MKKGKALVVRSFFLLLAVAALAAMSTTAVADRERGRFEDNNNNPGNNPGAVYVLTNQQPNSVLVYARAVDGSLTPSGSFLTGGMGAGTGADPLGSQGSLVLGQHHQLLFAVNAGSNDLSVFRVNGLNLELIDREPSGGTMPVSVAVHGGLLYVLNAGGTPNIQGFLVNPCGQLEQLAGSAQSLAGGAGSSPAQVSFSPNGDVLMVTEKNTNQIDTWAVDDDGFAHDQTVTQSSGATPFGFAFAHRDFAIVSEAGPSAVSSYDVDVDAQARLITGTLTDGGKANCWVVVTKNQHYAFTTNTGTGTISSYLISPDGVLALLNAVAANTGTGTAPIDMALSNNSHFLYVREATKGMVDGFRVESDGSLTPLNSAPGVPAGAQGVAAR
jgi:6-phosphogluconolactonase (cycloisomerase 2 family)